MVNFSQPKSFTQGLGVTPENGILVKVWGGVKVTNYRSLDPQCMHGDWLGAIYITPSCPLRNLSFVRVLKALKRGSINFFIVRIPEFLNTGATTYIRYSCRARLAERRGGVLYPVMMSEVALKSVHVLPILMA